MSPLHSPKSLLLHDNARQQIQARHLMYCAEACVNPALPAESKCRWKRKGWKRQTNLQRLRTIQTGPDRVKISRLMIRAASSRGGGACPLFTLKQGIMYVLLRKVTTTTLLADFDAFACVSARCFWCAPDAAHALGRQHAGPSSHGSSRVFAPRCSCSCSCSCFMLKVMQPTKQPTIHPSIHLIPPRPHSVMYTSTSATQNGPPFPRPVPPSVIANH